MERPVVQPSSSDKRDIFPKKTSTLHQLSIISPDCGLQLLPYPALLPYQHNPPTRQRIGFQDRSRQLFTLLSKTLASLFPWPMICGLSTWTATCFVNLSSTPATKQTPRQANKPKPIPTR